MKKEVRRLGNRPIIGISSSHSIAESRLSIHENYIKTILRAGGMPILLPQTFDRDVMAELLDSIDGLLLSGGGDILPARFGEETLPECGAPDAQRDAFELDITPMAIERHMPVFGVCRGIQVLNVALGGTLYQDIQTQCGLLRGSHYQPMPYHVPVHEVFLAEDGFVSDLIGVQSMMTNSMHHQSIKDVAPSLKVEGKTADGIIEIVSGKENDGIFGVQFHPEYLAEQNAAAFRFFEHFIKKAAEYRSSRNR